MPSETPAIRATKAETVVWVSVLETLVGERRGESLHIEAAKGQIFLDHTPNAWRKNESQLELHLEAALHLSRGRCSQKRFPSPMRTRRQSRRNDDKSKTPLFGVAARQRRSGDIGMMAGVPRGPHATML